MKWRRVGETLVGIHSLLGAELPQLQSCVARQGELKLPARLAFILAQYLC